MRTDILDKKELILEFIKDGKPKSEICKILNCKPITLDSYLLKMNIEYIGNKGRKGILRERKTALYYIENNIYLSSHKLKNKLIEDGIKEHRCEKCNLSTWNGVKIPIELHHVDGDKFNNELKNLLILCPNCHALTDNNSGRGTESFKNKLKNGIKESKLTKICECGVKIHKTSKSCEKCYRESRRNNIRPGVEILINELKESNYTKLGRKYGVSDNTIRKWIKMSA